MTQPTGGSTASSPSRWSRVSGWTPLRRRLVVAGVLVAVLLVAVWVVFWSSWLAARDVTVVGARTLGADRVLAAAQVDLGTPLVRLDLEAIQERVAALPAVASVTVHRSWPDTVAIDVTERQPVAAVRHDDSWWVADADGVIFRRTGERESGLPVIAIAAKDAAEVRAEAAGVAAALPSALAQRVGRITAHSLDSVTLHLKDGREVTWGSAAESDRKAQVLEVLLTQVDANAYDVRVPEQPTTSG